MQTLVSYKKEQQRGKEEQKEICRGITQGDAHGMCAQGSDVGEA